MPPLPAALIKTRAARLRAKGDEALRRHLSRWVGRESAALVERPGFARLSDFTSVNLAHDAGQAGAAMRLRFTAHDGRALIGIPA